MANYLYRTSLSKTGIGFPASNADDLEDFETNNKNSSIKISNIILSDTTFMIDESYQNFSARIISPIAWTDVKYIETPNQYDLLLLI